MPKKTVSRTTKALKMSDIKSVDAQGTEVQPDVMAELAAESRVISRKAPGVEISRTMLPLDSWGKEILVRTFNDGSTYYGPEHLSDKWHASDHFGIMGFLNSAAGVRLGHYALVEEGIHLRRSVNQLHRLYEGKFGYINFRNPELDPKWIKLMTDNGIEDLGHNYWVGIGITQDHGLKPLFQLAKHEKLEEVAARLNKTIAQLSPVSISIWKEGRNTKNKREGLEALLRVSRGELCVAVKPQIEKGKEWMLGVQQRRFTALFGSLEDLAKAVNGAAGSAREQKDADQDAFIVGQSVEASKEAEEKAVAMGEILTYGGKKFTAAQLVRTRVIKMVGDMEVGSELWLRDLKMVSRQVEAHYTDAGNTFKVVRQQA